MSSPLAYSGLREQPTLRRAAVVVSLVLAASGVLIARPYWVAPPLVASPWWVLAFIAGGFALAQVTQFWIDFRGERIHFVFSEVPTAFALAYLVPWQMCVVWVAATTLTQAVRYRTPWFKLAFNGSVTVGRVGISVLIVRQAGLDIGSVQGLAMIALAIALAETAGAAVTTSFVRWAGYKRIETGAMDVVIQSGQSVVGAAIGTWALLAGLEHPALLSLPAVVIGLIWQFSRQQVSDRQSYQDLLEVHGFLESVAEIEPVDLIPKGLAQLRRVLACRWAALVDIEGNVIGSAGDVALNPLPSAVPGEFSDTGSQPTRLPGGELGLPNATLSDGRTIVLGPPRHPDAEFKTRDHRRLRAAADLFETAITRSELQLKLDFEASHDPLTSLLARNGFVRSADRQLLANEGSGAVLVVDLVRFTDVNNTLGFKAGDILLAEAAKRLADALGPGPTLARLDTDSFAVFLGSGDHTLALDTAARIREAFEDPIDVRGLGLTMLVHIGIAMGPGHGATTEELLRAADVAADLAGHGRPTVVTYRAEADLHSEARLELLHRMRQALDVEAFDVYFQPKVDTFTGVVIGVEALLRWQEGDHWISPDEFIPAAETAGMMNELTDFVLRRSLSAIASLRDRGHQLGVAVNLSPSTLEDAHLPGRIAAQLRHFDVEPRSLTLEITESVVMGTSETASSGLVHLRSLGIRLSVDDFGTGYSSLRYLKDLDVDELKLDLSYVRDLAVSDRSEVISRAVIGLGHSLGLKVVAEGVETPAARQILFDIGCDILQGYLIARPMPIEQFTLWLEKYERTNGAVTKKDRRLAVEIDGPAPG